VSTRSVSQPVNLCSNLLKCARGEGRDRGAAWQLLKDPTFFHTWRTSSSAGGPTMVFGKGCTRPRECGMVNEGISLARGLGAMLSRAVVRASLWTLLGFVLATVSAYLAVDLGLADWVFGPGPEAWLDGKKELLQATLGLKGETIGRSLKVAGFACTLIFGALGFFNLWYHAEDNLPYRMVALNERVTKMHVEDRKVLIAPFQSRNLKGEQTPRPPQGVLQRVIGFFGTNSYRKSLKRLANGAETLDNDISVLSTNLEKCKVQRITAHLVEGLKLAAEATLMDQGSAAQREKNQAALTQFKNALKVDRYDLDALEHAARQSRLMSSTGAMLRYLLTMEHVAQNKRPTRYARSLRYQAEHLEESTKKADVKSARKKLEDAIAKLEEQPRNEETLLELALAHEQLATYHLNRGSPKLPGPYIDAAEKLFKDLPPPDGPAGVERIERLRKRLGRAQEGSSGTTDPGAGN
jgi:hypothetical protein